MLIPAYSEHQPHRNAEQFLRLWRNEALRVFHDRLICMEDKQLVLNRMAELVEQRFPTCSAHTLQDPILFGDFRCVLFGVGGKLSRSRVFLRWAVIEWAGP